MTSVVEPGAATRDRKISSLATSPAFGTFAIVFAIAAPVIYVVSEIANLPLFTYHPGTGRLRRGRARRGAPLDGRRPRHVLVWLDRDNAHRPRPCRWRCCRTPLPGNLGERIPLFPVMSRARCESSTETLE